MTFLVIIGLFILIGLLGKLQMETNPHWRQAKAMEKMAKELEIHQRRSFELQKRQAELQKKQVVLPQFQTEQPQIVEKSNSFLWFIFSAGLIGIFGWFLAANH